MKQGAFLLVTSSILALIALLHALRLLYGWSVTIGEWAVPVWVSALGFLRYEPKPASRGPNACACFGSRQGSTESTWSSDRLTSSISTRRANS